LGAGIFHQKETLIKKSLTQQRGEYGYESTYTHPFVGTVERQTRLELIQSGFLMSIFVFSWDKPAFAVGCRDPPFSEFRFEILKFGGKDNE